MYIQEKDGKKFGTFRSVRTKQPDMCRVVGHASKRDNQTPVTVFFEAGKRGLLLPLLPHLQAWATTSTLGSVGYY